MKKYFCLKLKQDPNFYYETEDTDPHQRELQLQFRLFIDNQFFHKIKITDTSLDQHKDLLKKRSYKEYQFLLFQAEQQSQIEPNTLSFTRVEIIHSKWFFTNEEARKINEADEKAEPAIVNEIISNRRWLEGEKNNFVNSIDRGSLWHGRIYDAPNDGYSLITSLALKNYLKDNELGDYQWWYDYILSPYCNSEETFNHRRATIRKAFFGFSQEPKLAGKRNFFSLAQRKQIFQNRELGEILTRNEKTKDGKETNFWKGVRVLIDYIQILKNSLEKNPERIDKTEIKRQYIIDNWKKDNSKDEIREDKQRVYQIFNELTDGFFDELVENPEVFVQKNKATAIQTFCADWAQKNYSWLPEINLSADWKDQSLVKNLQDLKEQITEALEKYRREDPTIPLEQLAQHFQKADFTDVPGLLEKMLKKTKKVDLPNIFETTTQIADFLRQIKLRKLAINKSKKENILIKTLRPGEEIILDFNIIGEDEKSGISNEYSAESGKFLTEKEYLVEPIIVHYSTEKSSEKETCLIEKIIIKQREENDLTGLLTLKGTCSEVEKITEAEVDEIIITCCALTIKSYEIIPTTEATSSPGKQGDNSNNNNNNNSSSRDMLKNGGSGSKPNSITVILHDLLTIQEEKNLGKRTRTKTRTKILKIRPQEIFSEPNIGYILLPVEFDDSEDHENWNEYLIKNLGKKLILTNVDFFSKGSFCFGNTNLRLEGLVIGNVGGGGGWK